MRITLGERPVRAAEHFHYRTTILAFREAAVILSIDQIAVRAQTGRGLRLGNNPKGEAPPQRSEQTGAVE